GEFAHPTSGMREWPFVTEGVWSATGPDRWDPECAGVSKTCRATVAGDTRSGALARVVLYHVAKGQSRSTRNVDTRPLALREICGAEESRHECQASSERGNQAGAGPQRQGGQSDQRSRERGGQEGGADTGASDRTEEVPSGRVGPDQDPEEDA